MYGCQRHAMDLPRPKIVTTENEQTEAGAAVNIVSNVKAVKSEVKKKKGLQEHNDRPQADDSPASSLSPCPTTTTNVQTPVVAKKMEAPSYRAGFLLGDGAGMVSSTIW